MPRKPGERYATKRRKDRERRYNMSRPAQHEFYATSEWRRLRDWYRGRYPLCEECQRQGRVTAAELVHHKREISQGGEPLLHDGAGYVRTDECIRVLGRVWRWGNG